jgi:hypothetical protein
MMTNRFFRTLGRALLASLFCLAGAADILGRIISERLGP